VEPFNKELESSYHTNYIPQSKKRWSSLTTEQGTIIRNDEENPFNLAKLILMYTNPMDWVCDPFAGSYFNFIFIIIIIIVLFIGTMTAALACIRWARRCLSIEKDKYTFSLANQRKQNYGNLFVINKYQKKIYKLEEEESKNCKEMVLPHLILPPEHHYCFYRNNISELGLFFYIATVLIINCFLIDFLALDLNERRKRLLKHFKLSINTSTIPDAGRGLFTARYIPKGINI
jgi:hypothetical protein